MVIRTRARKESAKAKAKEEALREKEDKQKEEILDAIYWMRQTGGIIVGIIYGAFKITGSSGITSFLALSLTSPTAVMKRIHKFDEEELQKVGSVSTEGMLPGFALFLLSWIITYTTFL